MREVSALQTLVITRQVTTILTEQFNEIQALNKELRREK